MKKYCLLILILTVSLLNISCVRLSELINDGEIPVDNNGDKVVTETVDKPEAGGKITIASLEPNSINPIKNKYATCETVNKLIFEGLFEVDKEFRLQPLLAQSYIINNNKITIMLRDNLVWSDGVKITAEDIVFTISNIKLDNGSVYYSKVKDIKTYKAVNINTVEIVLNQASYNGLFNFDFPIIPKHIYENKKNTNIIGSGPYKVQVYNKGKGIELNQNDKWLRKGEKVVPYINTVSVVFIHDIETFETSFRTRMLDIINAASFEWEKFLEQKDVAGYTYDTTEYEYILLNHNNEALKNIRIREIIDRAINKEEIVSKILFDNAVVTQSPVSPHSWLYSELPKPGGYGMPYITKVLTESGYADKPLTLTLATNEENNGKVATCKEIQKYLGAIGIKVELVVESFEDLKANVEKNKYDMVYLTYKMDMDFDMTPLVASKRNGGNKNYGNYSNDELDQLLAKIQDANSEEELKAVYKEIQVAINAQLPIISVNFKKSALIARNKIKGEITPIEGNIFYGIDKWYIKTKK